MDNENQTNTGQPTPVDTASPAAPTESASLLEKHPGLKSLAGVAGVAIFLLAAIAIRNNYLEGLQGTGADASCYGYNCEPNVVIGGRSFNYGYNNDPFSYGTLNIRRGSMVELTWYGTNVDRCSAKWTDFNGTYYPPTVQSQPITRPQKFTVTCTKGRHKVSSTLNVRVIRNSGTGFTEFETEQ